MNPEEEISKIAEIEALLFQYGEPTSIKKISNILDIKRESCETLINQYESELNENEKRGLTILRKGDKVQLVTKPVLKRISLKIAKKEFAEELTPAALEVLTIIAYLGPILKTTIDFTRGVNSNYILRNLLIRGLIEREQAGHTYNYQVTFDFLKHLGIGSIEKLPDFEEYRKILEDYREKISNT